MKKRAPFGEWVEFPNGTTPPPGLRRSEVQVRCRSGSVETWMPSDFDEIAWYRNDNAKNPSDGDIVAWRQRQRRAPGASR